MTRVCPFCSSDLPAAPDPASGALTQLCPTFNQELDTPQPPGAGSPEMESGPNLAQQLGRPMPPPSPPPLPSDSSTPAWESERSFLSGLWRTTWQVLFSPTATFGAPAAPGQRWPLTYSLILGTLSEAAYILWEHLLDPGGISVYVGLGLFLLTPVQNLVGLYVGSGLIHLMLLMVGGAKRGFNATFRVLGYGNAAGVWLLVPYLGLPLFLIWSLVVMISGLAVAHGISRGRAFWAWVIFLLLLTGLALIMLLGISLVAMLMGSPCGGEGWLGL